MDSEDMFVDSKEILDDISSYVLASYFMETRKNAKKKAALSWIESIDLDSLAMIAEYGEKMKDEDDEVAAENTKPDLFDKPMLDEEVEEDEEGRYIQSKEVSEGMEIYALTVLLLAWEHDQRAVPLDITEPAMQKLVLYANMEILRRKKYVTATGSGTLLSKTNFFPTAKGKKFGKKIAKAIAASQPTEE